MTRHVLLLVTVAACAAGCTPAYTVHVNTFSEFKEPLSPTAPIYVSIDPNSRNPILAEKMASKIRTMLQDQGYRPTNKAETADYVLTFRAGIDSAPVMDYMPIYRPWFYGYYRYGYHGLGYGYTGYVPYVETAYNHWLEMRLFAHPPKAKDKNQPVWIGEATVGRSDAELRESVDYLLIGLLEYFSTDTGRWVRMRLTRDDPRVLALAQTP